MKFERPTQSKLGKIRWLSNASSDKHFSTSCLAIVGLAVLLRLIWVTIMPVEPLSDSVAYDTFAVNLLEYGVYGWTKSEPFAFWPPGTSFIYAALYGIFGHSYWPIKIFNIIVSGSIVFLTIQLGARLANREIALLSGLIIATWPSLILYCSVLASELPYLLLTLWALVIWLYPSRNPMFGSVFGGVLLGLACYVRPTALLLPIVYSIPVVASAPFKLATWRNELQRIVSALLVMLVLIAPWTYRNYLVYGEPVLISTNGSITFWMGNSPGTTGEYAKVPGWALKLNDLERAKALRQEAVAYIQANPVEFVQRTIYKAFRLHSHETIGVTWNSKGISTVFGEIYISPLKIITTGYWYIVLLLALYGIFILSRKNLIRGLTHPLVVIWIYYIGVHSVIVTQDRYHFSFAPHLAILASLAICHLMSPEQIGKPSRPSDASEAKRQ